MTLNELMVQVQYVLSEKNIDHFHEPEKIKSWLVEAQNQFCSLTQQLNKISLIDEFEETGDPIFEKTLKIPDAVNVHRVIYDDKPLDETSINLLSLIEGANLVKAEAGIPKKYIMLSPIEVGLYPSPYIGAAVGDDVYVAYAYIPAIPDDEDPMSIPDQYIGALVDYAIFRSMLKDHDPRANQFYGAYYEQVQIAQSFMHRGHSDGFRVRGRDNHPFATPTQQTRQEPQR